MYAVSGDLHHGRRFGQNAQATVCPAVKICNREDLSYCDNRGVWALVCRLCYPPVLHAEELLQNRFWLESQSQSSQEAQFQLQETEELPEEQ